MKLLMEDEKSETIQGKEKKFSDCACNLVFYYSADNLLPTPSPKKIVTMLISAF